LLCLHFARTNLTYTAVPHRWMDGWMDGWMKVVLCFSFHPSFTIHFCIISCTLLLYGSFLSRYFSFALFLFLFLFFLLPWFYAMTYKRKNLVYSEDTFSCTILCLQRAGTFRLTSCTMISKCLYFSSFEKEIVKPFVMPLSLFFYNDASFYAKENFCCSLYSR